MSLDRSEAAALSRLFSATVLRELGKQGRSPLFARLVDHTRLATYMSPKETVGTAFDKAFELLSKSRFRDDYVYRTAITEKIVLGRHNLNTATLLNEVRAGSCKADVVILNGTSTAYEIKSERDSLSRLQNQIFNYRQVFATVNVVVSKSHLSEVLKATPEDVGVITLSERFRFQTSREAQSRAERIVPRMALEVLRVDEAAAVLTRLGLEVPGVPNTQIRSELDRIFAELDPTAVHEELVKTLRASRSQANLASFIDSIPASIRAASLAAKPNPKSRIRIKEAVDTPLAEALAWN
ncbi:sce7726 family protein [Brevibacterium sp. XM4083]|uniref:sce7726 family protein n=1 Tax=Brevibacterium sp. XM4083 TaxID=2583238 RepID=UPI001C64362D|nr:sce7726 family protein [Brevibacterium sp. XM4083]MCM1012319.1 sce7726 family protein [Brevibacterium sp. XM4083]